LTDRNSNCVFTARNARNRNSREVFLAFLGGEKKGGAVEQMLIIYVDDLL